MIQNRTIAIISARSFDFYVKKFLKVSIFMLALGGIYSIYRFYFGMPTNFVIATLLLFVLFPIYSVLIVSLIFVYCRYVKKYDFNKVDDILKEACR